jgi:hypothetical protein
MKNEKKKSWKKKRPKKNEIQDKPILTFFLMEKKIDFIRLVCLVS